MRANEMLAVGLFRTLYATVPCGHCGKAYRTDVQFRTGHDNLEEYEAARPVGPEAGLRHGEPYEAQVDFYCPDCQRERFIAETAAFYEALIEFTEAGRLALRKGLLFKQSLDPEKLAQKRDERLRSLRAHPTDILTPFHFVGNYEMTWDGQAAEQGTPLYNSFLENMNQRISEKLEFQGWLRTLKLRRPARVWLDDRNLLQVALDETPG